MKPPKKRQRKAREWCVFKMGETWWADNTDHGFHSARCIRVREVLPRRKKP